MTHKYKLTLAVLVVGAACVVFAVTLVRAVYAPPVEEEAPPPVAFVEAKIGDRPARLRIPRIEVDAHVQHVGIGKSGNMSVPSNFSDVGWYRYGAVPGAVGSAVMDGHVDNALALPGVFKRLGELQAGDAVEVETNDGRVLRFVVTEVVSYATAEVPAERIFNARGGARLNLITCDGAWVQEQKTYDRRLVVYAELA